MQHPMLTTFTVTFCLQTKCPRILCPPSPEGGHNVAVTKRPPFFTWIVTKCPLCDIFPAFFMTSLFPHCDILSLCNILPLSDTGPPSHILTFTPAVSFSSSSGHILSPSLLLLFITQYVIHVCVQKLYITEFIAKGRGVMVSQTEEKSIKLGIIVPCALT